MGNQREHQSSIWGWRRRLSTQVWLLWVCQLWCGCFLLPNSPVVQSSQSVKRKSHFQCQSTKHGNSWNVLNNIKVTERPWSPAYIHPVAFPSNRGDGPVQASLHLPLDERIVAVYGHHKLLQHWFRVEDNSWVKQERIQWGECKKHVVMWHNYCAAVVISLPHPFKHPKFGAWFSQATKLHDPFSSLERSTHWVQNYNTKAKNASGAFEDLFSFSLLCNYFSVITQKRFSESCWGLMVKWVVQFRLPLASFGAFLPVTEKLSSQADISR